MKDQLQSHLDMTEQVFDPQDYTNQLYEEAVSYDFQYIENIERTHTALVQKAYDVYRPSIVQQIPVDDSSRLYLFATKPSTDHPSHVITVVRSNETKFGTFNTLLYTFGSIIELRTDIARRGLSTRHDYDNDRITLGATQSIYHCGKKRNIPVYDSSHLGKLSELLDQFRA